MNLARAASWRAGLAVLAVAVATAIKLAGGGLLAGDVNLVYLTAVALSAWVGGFRAGVLATTLAVLAQLYLFIPPVGIFTVDDPAALAHLIVSTVEALLLCAMFHALERARRRAVALAAEAESRAVELAARGVELRDAHDHLELKVAERTESLRTSEANHRLLFEASPLPMMVFDNEDLSFVQVNTAAANQYGYTIDELMTLDARVLRIEADREKMRRDLRALPVDWSGPARHRTKDGRVMDMQVTARTLVLGGRTVRWCLVLDVTEQVRVRRQADRLETIGRLAGGVAHDFNNMLTVVSMSADLALGDLDDEEARDLVKGNLEDISAATSRAAQLSRKLLSFSKHELLERREVHLGEVVRAMERLLRRVVDERIELRVDLNAPNDTIVADPGELEQIVMNLAVNARDAMPEGGTLSLSTRETDGSVVFVVRDSGTGMSEATRARIFDAFFSTKGKDKGTGLGLATVERIVRAHGGTIEVESALGVGTAFTVTFPLAQATAAPISRETQRHERGHETILLAEDDESVRRATAALLKRHGYQVIEASDGAEALAICERGLDGIDLLLSDVMMPKLDGPDLARKIAALRPTLPIVCTSGYAADGVMKDLDDLGVVFLQKPLVPAALTQTLRELLDRRRLVPAA